MIVENASNEGILEICCRKLKHKNHFAAFKVIQLNILIQITIWRYVIMTNRGMVILVNAADYTRMLDYEGNEVLISEFSYISFGKFWDHSNILLTNKRILAILPPNARFERGTGQEKNPDRYYYSIYLNGMKVQPEHSILEGRLCLMRCVNGQYYKFEHLSGKMELIKELENALNQVIPISTPLVSIPENENIVYRSGSSLDFSEITLEDAFKNFIGTEIMWMFAENRLIFYRINQHNIDKKVDLSIEFESPSIQWCSIPFDSIVKVKNKKSSYPVLYISGQFDLFQIPGLKIYSQEDIEIIQTSNLCDCGHKALGTFTKDIESVCDNKTAYECAECHKLVCADCCKTSFLGKITCKFCGKKQYPYGYLNGNSANYCVHNSLEKDMPELNGRVAERKLIGINGVWEFEMIINDDSMKLILPYLQKVKPNLEIKN